VEPRQAGHSCPTCHGARVVTPILCFGVWISSFAIVPSANILDDLDALFTGDLLFAGSIGRTDLPGGDHQQILHSLARTLTLPDETTVLPGHGPQTTIGDERRTNPFLTGLQPAQKGL